MTPGPDDERVLLQAMVDAAPVGLAVFDCDLRYVRVNEALCRINGVSLEDHVGRRVDDVLPELPPSIVEDMRTVFDTGRTVTREDVVTATPQSPGVARHFLVNYYPIGSSYLGATVVEISEWRRAEAERDRLLEAEHHARHAAEQAVDRLARLQAATAGLAEASDMAAVADVVVSQCVGGLGATAGALCVVGENDVVSVVRAEGFDPEILDRYDTFPLSASVPAAEAIRSRQPILLASGAERDARFPELTGLAPEHGSFAAVPMLSDGRAMGAITLAWPLERQFSLDETSFMLALGRQAGQALERARLYETERTVARTLQASLLPPKMPVIPGVELAFRYHAAFDMTEVGGDFYDVFPMGDGRWGVVMGDVCGKGVPAASLTALARHTVRAGAIDAGDPTTVLRLVNRAILGADEEERFCTLCHAVLDPLGDGKARITVASAGHPLPFLVRVDGDVVPIGQFGNAAGMFPEFAVTEVEDTMGPGDALVLYTDGYIEARSPEGDFGSNLLEAALRKGAGLDAEGLADLVDETVLAFEGGRPRDDMALLIVRVNPLDAI